VISGADPGAVREGAEPRARGRARHEQAAARQESVEGVEGGRGTRGRVGELDGCRPGAVELVAVGRRRRSGVIAARRVVRGRLLGLGGSLDRREQHRVDV
jgi:hypothetical protein